MAIESKINTKRIATNTLYMYLRMFVILGVTLYTARIVIRTLGIDDYGIYNIIGGIVILFSFVNISLRSAIQRFISFELGKDDILGSHRIISSSFYIVLIFSAIFLVLSETIGLWFVSNKLVIPSEKILEAQWVYQFSILTFIIQLFQTPYQAIILSHEKMSFYAGYSVVEVALKLLVALLIATALSNKLIIYAALGAVVSIISLLSTALYSHKCLKIPFKFCGQRRQFKEMFSYSGWSMANSSTVIVAQQGGNILLNLFIGVIANGAFGIANQVTAAVYGFISNFQSAFNPQITKSYSAGEIDATIKLLNRASLFSFSLFALIAVPFFIENDYILKLWLGECPEYASGFCCLMMLYFLVDSMQAPLWMLIFATGKVRIYQIWSGAITLLNIPLAWYLLAIGFSAYWVFIVRLGLNIIIGLVRPFYLHTLVPEFALGNFVRSSVFPIIKIGFLCALIVISGFVCQSYLHPLIIILISFLSAGLVVLFAGLNKSERSVIRGLIVQKFRK